jgi:response regulator RpfG family c-di-GMP phosphodiesterase
LEKASPLGTTFCLYLPKYLGDNPSLPPMETVLIINEPQISKILVVEDDEILREVFVELLETLNCHVQWAKDGQECLKKIKETGDFDVIFSDIKIPKINGIDFLKVINKHNKK